MIKVCLNKTVYKLIALLLMYIFCSCQKSNQETVLNTQNGIEIMEVQDFQLENVYFLECQEKQLFCINEENVEKYIRNIIVLRKALNEREQKFLLIKEIVMNDTTPEFSQKTK